MPFLQFLGNNITVVICFSVTLLLLDTNAAELGTWTWYFAILLNKQPKRCEKMFSNYVSGKMFVFKICQESNTNAYHHQSYEKQIKSTDRYHLMPLQGDSIIQKNLGLAMWCSGLSLSIQQGSILTQPELLLLQTAKQSLENVTEVQNYPSATSQSKMLIPAG